MTVIECQDCEWQGNDDDLIAIVPHPTSISDFIYCPECEGTEFAEVQVDYQPTVRDGE